jgi:outer membrane protein OmpA-like peptidoglycan-associated protein
MPPAIAQMLASAASSAASRPVADKPRQEQHTLRATVRFPFADATLTQEAKVELRKLAPQLASATRIRVTGYTDDQGAAQPNDRLATQRALAVVLHLRDELGVAGAHVTGTGRPLCCYRAPNRDDAGRATNRRAELDIDLSPSAPSQADPEARVVQPALPAQPIGVTEKEPS